MKCQVLLSFSQSVADLPIDECEGPKPASQQVCYSGPCSGEAAEYNPEEIDIVYGSLQDFDELYDWEYAGFTECSESCGGGESDMFLSLFNLLSCFQAWSYMFCNGHYQKDCFVSDLTGKLLKIKPTSVSLFRPRQYQAPELCYQL